MALESATFITDLVATNPVAGDAVSQGDDHIRLVKDVLRNSFPGISEAFTLPVPISKGGTGASTASAARLALDLPCIACNNVFTGINQFATAGFGQAPSGGAQMTSAGNVAVGPTNVFETSSGTTDGVGVYAVGLLRVSSNGGTCAEFRRRAGDGISVLFRRDTTAVGNISVTTTATAYNTSSDARDKVDLGREPEALDKLRALVVHRTRFIEEPEGSERPMFFAQEVEQVLPQAAFTDPETGKKFVSYGDFVPTLVAALQDALARIEVLEAARPGP